MAADNVILEHLRAIAQAAGVETSDAQLQQVAPQVVMLLRRFPAARADWPLGESEPAFGLQIERS